MISRFTFTHIIFILTISDSCCRQTEQIIAEIGEKFSFDCKPGESVYFSRRSKPYDWSDIQKNVKKYPYLQLEFNSLSEENILRVTSDSAQSQHTGYYACGQAGSINRKYQLVLADVQSFYWTYICHGPAGSCTRTDDENDETLSTFEVADRTNVDLFCCASVTGYKDIDINMNQIGENRDQISVKRKQDLDGSWVVCANQGTVLTRTSSQKQQALTCELITDGRSYSSFSSDIVMKDAMAADPDFDPPFGYTPPLKGGSDDDIDVTTGRPSRAGKDGKLTTGKKIAIIVGSVLGGLLFLGLVFGLIFCLCFKKRTRKNYKTNESHEYAEVNIYDKSNKSVPENLKEDEYCYLEPTPHYENTPVTFRV